MSNNPFDTDEQVQEILSLFLYDLGSAAEALYRAQQLPQPARAYIALTLQRELCAGLDATDEDKKTALARTVADLREEAAEVASRVRNNDPEFQEQEPVFLKLAQESAKVVWFISENAGNQVHPFVHYCAEEFCKASLFGLPSMEQHLLAQAAALEKFISPPPAQPEPPAPQETENAALQILQQKKPPKITLKPRTP